MKQQLDGALVQRLARKFAAVEPTFHVAEFTRRASVGLDELELMARIQHIAAATEAVLPPRPAWKSSCVCFTPARTREAPGGCRRSANTLPA